MVTTMVMEGSDDTTPDSPEMCRALFAYTASRPDELSLEVNDFITYLGEKEDGWWLGKLGENVGLFPSNFVQVVSRQNSSTKRRKSVSNLNLKPKSNMRTTRTSVGEMNNHHLESSSNDIHIAATSLIQQQQTNNHSGSSRSLSSNPPREDLPVLPPKPVKEQCIATYPYDGCNDDELTLCEGDVITIISKEVQDTGWWYGMTTKNNKTGLFPDNFVKPLTGPSQMFQQQQSSIPSNRRNSKDGSSNSSVFINDTSPPPPPSQHTINAIQSVPNMSTDVSQHVQELPNNKFSTKSATDENNNNDKVLNGVNKSQLPTKTPEDGRSGSGLKSVNKYFKDSIKPAEGVVDMEETNVPKAKSVSKSVLKGVQSGGVVRECQDYTTNDPSFKQEHVPPAPPTSSGGGEGIKSRIAMLVNNLQHNTQQHDQEQQQQNQNKITNNGVINANFVKTSKLRASWKKTSATSVISPTTSPDKSASALPVIPQQSSMSVDQTSPPIGIASIPTPGSKSRSPSIKKSSLGLNPSSSSPPLTTSTVQVQGSECSEGDVMETKELLASLAPATTSFTDRLHLPPKPIHMIATTTTTSAQSEQRRSLMISEDSVVLQNEDQSILSNKGLTGGGKGRGKRKPPSRQFMIQQKTNAKDVYHEIKDVIGFVDNVSRRDDNINESIDLHNIYNELIVEEHGRSRKSCVSSSSELDVVHRNHWQSIESSGSEGVDQHNITSMVGSKSEDNLCSSHTNSSVVMTSKTKSVSPNIHEQEKCRVSNVSSTSSDCSSTIVKSMSTNTAFNMARLSVKEKLMKSGLNNNNDGMLSSHGSTGLANIHHHRSALLLNANASSKYKVLPTSQSASCVAALEGGTISASCALSIDHNKKEDIYDKSCVTDQQSVPSDVSSNAAPIQTGTSKSKGGLKSNFVRQFHSNRGKSNLSSSRTSKSKDQAASDELCEPQHPLTAASSSPVLLQQLFHRIECLEETVKIIKLDHSHSIASLQSQLEDERCKRQTLELQVNSLQSSISISNNTNIIGKSNVVTSSSSHTQKSSTGRFFSKSSHKF